MEFCGYARANKRKGAKFLKLKRAVLVTVSVLPLILTYFITRTFPKNVPIHYNQNLILDRYGSRKESLILAAIVTIIGLLILYFANSTDDKFKHVFRLDIGVAVEIVIQTLMFVVLFIQGNNVIDLRHIPLGIRSIVMMVLGNLFIIVGNMLPMSKPESVLGFSAPWAKKNETVWKKSQLFSGLSIMLLGAASIGLAFYRPSVKLFLAAVAAVLFFNLVYSALVSFTNRTE